MLMSKMGHKYPRRRALTGLAAASAAMILPGTSSISAQTENWSGAQLSEPGFVQVRSSVYVGMTISNPNTGVAISDIEIESTAYDAGGTVLRTSSEFVEWLAPGETLSVADLLLLSDGQQVGYLSCRVTKQSYRSSQPIIVENPRFVEDRFLSSATGLVRNPYPRSLSDVRVYAVFYDSSGRILGGNSSSVSNVPAFGTAAARVIVPEGVRPARIEMSAVLTLITEFRD